MIVEKDIARQIRSGKRNMLRLAAKSGRCPYRPNSVYVIQTTRGGPTECVITITDVQSQLFEDEPVWILRFKRGDHTDKPRLMSKRIGSTQGDYTQIPALAARGEQECVSDDTAKRYAQESAERHGRSLAEQAERALTAIADIRGYADDPRSFKRLRAAENQIRALSVRP